MSKFKLSIIIPMLAVMSLLVGACGGSEPEPQPAKVPAEKESGVKQLAAEPGMVTSLEDVRSATVRIEAEGTFVDPQDGMTATWAGSGSGFIIDPSVPP
jgi:serine protease Do